MQEGYSTHRTPSLRRRLACLLYESLLLFGVLYTASYFFSVISQTKHALSNRHAQQAVLFFVLGLYFVWSWRKGYTLAMKTWKIRMVAADTNTCTDANADANANSNPLLQPVHWKQATVRFLLAWVWVLPPVLLYAFLSSKVFGYESPSVLLWLLPCWILFWAGLAQFHPQRQFWHDALAKTRLINDDSLNKKAKKVLSS